MSCAHYGVYRTVSERRNIGIVTTVPKPLKPDTNSLHGGRRVFTDSMRLIENTTLHRFSDWVHYGEDDEFHTNSL